MDLRSSAPLEFLNLTVRDSKGAESTTAFWFAVDGDRVLTLLTDRRIATAVTEDPEVLVSFSGRRGDADSARMSAVAQPLVGEAAAQVTTLLNEKYGLRRRAFRFMFWFSRRLGSTWDHEDHAFQLILVDADTTSP